jgi:hypothetical protein
MTASQKIGRAAAFNLFIVLILLLRASVPGFSFTLSRTAADALRFSAGDIAQELRRMASKIFVQKATEPTDLHKRKVTELLPAQPADVFSASKLSSSTEVRKQLFFVMADFFQ